MKDHDKSKAQIIEELERLRRRVAELEAKASVPEHATQKLCQPVKKPLSESAGDPATIEPDTLPATLSFRDIVNTDDIQTMMNLFYELTGFPIGIIDVSNHILVATGWQEICTRFHRKHPETCSKCFESDRHIKSFLDEGRYVEYKCKNGLWDIAQPIIIEGQHLANIFLGQFLYEDETLNRDFFIRQAQKYGFDKTAYLNALERLPIFSRETVKKVMKFYVKLAHILSEQGLANLNLMNEIENRKRVETALRITDERLNQALQATDTGIVDFHPQSGELYFSPHWYTLLGYGQNEISNRLEAWVSLIHPEDRPHVVDSLEHFLRNGGEAYHIEFRLQTKAGDWRWIRCSGKPYEWDREGNIIRMIGTHTDITVHKQMEDQLLQSQKMESIGTLTGGIAHDFNNLLTVINGNVELILMDLDEENPLYNEIHQILQAGRKAEGLTRQLLAFSRKQVYQPQVVGINQLITGLDKMMRRLISENIHMEIRLGDDIQRIKADPGQIEQILVNLIVNARDAINARTQPNGAKTITIETGQQYLNDAYVAHHPGSRTGLHIFFSVTDTGAGIREEVKNRIFEPFYTTKTLGKGTGLGLATVYGIVQQNRGSISVSSEPEQGTTFTIYWPCATEADRVKPAEIRKETEMKGNGTLLVVEDEAGVRNFTCQALRKMGYSVYDAAHGKAALTLTMEKNLAPDLLITDVIMPEMNGKELADEMSRRFPGIRILYVSGYTDDCMVNDGELDAGIHFIQKPYSAKALKLKVNEVLGR